MEPRERGFAHELAWGTTRLRGRLDGLLDAHVSRSLSELDGPVLELLRLGTYQIHYMDSVPAYAAVSATVDQVRVEAGARPTGFVNAVLRRVAADTAVPPEDMNSLLGLTTWGSHPEWLVQRWLSRYDVIDVRRLVEHDNSQPPTSILPIGITSKEALARLAEEGVEASLAAEWSPCLRLADTSSVASALRALPISIVQDPASNLVARYADVSSGTIVADLCAAPGGKALALSDRAARVIALDRSESRMRMVKDNANRTERPLELVIADANSLPLVAADVVMVDAPCTGTATLARHPDSRWRLKEEGIAEMAALQGRMLDAAADVVRPGGMLVYSTCTLEPEENERCVSDFLARHSEYVLEPSEAFTHEDPGGAFVDSEGFLRVEPWRSGYDGSFAARLRKAL